MKEIVYMKKLNKTLAVLMATVIAVAMFCGISVNATETSHQNNVPMWW